MKETIVKDWDEGWDNWDNITIPIDKLDMNPVQPKNRITDSAIRNIVETLTNSKMLLAITVTKGAGDRYIICDGHRRYKAALKLGRTNIRCAVIPAGYASPQVWFIWLNASLRNVKSNDWFSVWAHSSGRKTVTMKHIPRRVASQIEDMVDIFGADRAIEIGKEGKQAPGVAETVRFLFEKLKDFNFVSGTAAQKSTIGEWVMRHNQQNPIRRILSGRDAQRRDKVAAFHKAIQLDKPVFDTKTKKRLRNRNSKSTQQEPDLLSNDE